MKIKLFVLLNLVSSVVGAKLHDPYRMSTLTNNHSSRSIQQAIQSRRLFSLYKKSVLQCMAGYKSGCKRMQIITTFHSQAPKFSKWKPFPQIVPYNLRVTSWSQRNDAYTVLLLFKYKISENWSVYGTTRFRKKKTNAETPIFAYQPPRITHQVVFS